MKPIKIELDWDAVDDIVRSQLTDAKDIMEYNYNQRKQGVDMLGIFHHDADMDCKEMEKHIDALNLIINFYK